jgi:3-oxoacyl-[acyl-carrier protein] reductase
VADLAEPVQARAARRGAADGPGGLDILVNNAGILLMAPLLEITPEAWDRTFAVNVRSMLCTIQAAVPHYVRGRAARSSTWPAWAARSASPGQAHYASSKARSSS